MLSIPVAFEAFKLLKLMATLLTLISGNLKRMSGQRSTPALGIWSPLEVSYKCSDSAAMLISTFIKYSLLYRQK